MLNLTDVSASVLVDQFPVEFQKELSKFELKTLEDVNVFLKGYQGKDKLYYHSLLSSLKQVLTRENNRGCTPEKYYVRPYSDLELSYVDNMNYGDVLMLINPTIIDSVRYQSIYDKTIRTIKEEISLTDIHGTNYLKSQTTNVGKRSFPNIVFAIDLYQRQVERQAKLTTDRTINLFELHQEEKRRIIDENYEDIILFLLENTQSKLIWGNLTAPQKSRLISSVFNNSQEDKFVRENVSRYLTDYTTIDELTDSTHQKELIKSRFIIK